MLLSATSFWFQVCQLHFKPDDIEYVTSFFDEATGRKLTAKLGKPRLKDGVIPSLLPNCPSYLSSPAISRESPDSRRIRKEEKALQSALAESVVEEELQRASRTFFSARELGNKLDFLNVLTESKIMNQGKKRKLETLNKSNNKKQKMSKDSGKENNK